MQLTCPACGARYAVEEGAIPAGGRMVRCSNCHAEWRAGALPRVPAARSADARQGLASAGPARQAEPPAAMPSASDRPPARAALAAQPSPPPPVRSEALAASLEEPRSARGGFMAGFAVVSLLALGAVAVYARHADVAAAVPRLAEPLEHYVALVDRARAELAQAVDRLR
jgi:predicted Zn finger-like uncharacterized protein